MGSAVLTLLGVVVGVLAAVATPLVNNRESQRKRQDARRVERLDRAADLLSAAQRVEFALDKPGGADVQAERASAMADTWLAQKRYDLVCAEDKRQPAFRFVCALDEEVREPREGWNPRVRDARHAFLDSARST